MRAPDLHHPRQDLRDGLRRVMLQVKVWDIVGGEASKVVATADSFQMTNQTLRDDDDHTVLYLNEMTWQWVVYDDGTEWSDFTIEKAGSD